MSSSKSLQSLTHEVPDDFFIALSTKTELIDAWNSLTTLGKNEFICWIISAKQQNTRLRRIDRAVNDILGGKKRPCCWAGCIHRKDKKPSNWQQNVLINNNKK